MIVRWSIDAERDRGDIYDFIASRNLHAANRIDDLFHEAVTRLELHPLMGREGALPATREVVPHPSYRVVYEIIDDVVVVLALVHTSRQWPPDAP